MATKSFRVSAPSTPPESDLPLQSHAPAGRFLPPSPPFSPAGDREQQQRCLEPAAASIDQILTYLTHYTSGGYHPFGACVTFDLPPSQLADFQRRLRVDGWEDKTRYDYYGTTVGKSQLCLRMPSAIHEQLTQAFADEIQKELGELAKRFSLYDEQAAFEAGRIKKSGSTTLEYQPPDLVDCDDENDIGPEVVRHSPDASFIHKETGPEAPGLVIEVGYSQQSKKLSHLAESYITNSRHKIRCVIALDIVYSSSKQTGNRCDKTATISLWRPGVEEHEDGDIGVCMPIMEAIPFRDGEGRVCDGSLILSVSDFLQPSLCKGFSGEANQDVMTIAFATLARLLDEAEACSESRVESEDGIPKRFRRKRKRSPIEELSSPRENSFANLELADSTKEQSKDAEWQGNSKRRATGHTPKPRRSVRNKERGSVAEDVS